MFPPVLLVCDVSHTGVQREVDEEDEENDEEDNDEDDNQDDPGIELVVKADVVSTDPLTLNNNDNNNQCSAVGMTPFGKINWKMSPAPP